MRGGETVPREKTAFRDTYQALNEAIPDKSLLNVSDIAKYEGRSREKVRASYRRNRDGKLLKADYLHQVLS